MRELSLGIDQSLTCTGFAVIEKDTLELVEYGKIKTKVKGVERLQEIEHDILSTIKEYHNVNGDIIHQVVGIEGYAYAKAMKGSRVFELGELGGVIKLGLMKEGFTPLVIPVQQHTKKLIGTGRSKKSPRIEAVNDIYNLDLKVSENPSGDSDIADAISIARYVAEFA